MLEVKRSLIVSRLNNLNQDRKFDNEPNEVLEEHYCLSGLFMQYHHDPDEEWDENDLVIVD